MIRFLVMDVDGTLTDGKIYMGQQGELFKAFDIKDGYGIRHLLPTKGIIPVVITVYADHTFSFVTKTPPAAVLIKKACGIDSGSGVPNKTKVATITSEQVRKIAEQKMPDLNAASIETAMSMIAGTCRSMGVVVAD